MCGQQPGLFGGTLLSFEKAAGAIALAARLREELGVPVVPIFWNQSEDHDLEEVEPVRRARSPTAWRACARRSRTSAARSTRSRSTTPSWRSRRDAVLECGLDAALGRRAPARSRASGSRTGRRACSLHVFGDEGLLMAEPSWFRGLTTPLIRRAIDGRGALHDGVRRARREALRAHGIEPQVETRDRSMLFLVSDRTACAGGSCSATTAGRRTRRERASRRRSCSTGSSAGRSDFSANVQLRAVIQQILFPVAVQVGGPAEVAYFAQFPEMFRLLDLPLPRDGRAPRLDRARTEGGRAPARRSGSTRETLLRVRRRGPSPQEDAAIAALARDSPRATPRARRPRPEGGRE